MSSKYTPLTVHVQASAFVVGMSSTWASLSAMLTTHRLQVSQSSVCSGSGHSSSALPSQSLNCSILSPPYITITREKSCPEQLCENMMEHTKKKKKKTKKRDDKCQHNKQRYPALLQSKNHSHLLSIMSDEEWLLLQVQDRAFTQRSFQR